MRVRSGGGRPIRHHDFRMRRMEARHELEMIKIDFKVVRDELAPLLGLKPEQARKNRGQTGEIPFSAL